MPESVVIASKNQTELAAVHATPPAIAAQKSGKMLVLMLHEFPGNKDGAEGFFADLQPILEEEGYASLRFDFGGCGESQGEEHDFSMTRAHEDLKGVYSWADVQGYSDFIVLAEGLGTTLALLHPPEELKGLAMCWPVLDIPLYNEMLLRGCDMGEAVRERGYFEKNGRKIGLDFMFELKKTLLKQKLEAFQKPAALIQAAQDEVLPKAHIDVARATLSSKRLDITVFHDGRHGLPQEYNRKAAYYHILQFIKKNA